MNEVKVSVCVLSYNHEKYLRDCLEGIVMQRTTFPIEAWVHDDASTDSSQEIIKEYQQRYPEIIKPILQTENQYSKKRGSILQMFLYPQCTGKYIAICEGDDYWTDPYKLQKQFDYLETNIEFSMCFHQAKVLSDDKEDVKLYKHLEEREYRACEIYKDWIIPTCSILFRANAIPVEKIPASIVYGDIYLFLLLAEMGRIYNLNFEGAVYRRNSGGVSQKEDVELYIRLLDQYIFMEKRFPQKELVQVSRELQELYLKCIISTAYFPDRWKYRLLYMTRHPKLFFSKFGLVTLWQLFHKPIGKSNNAKHES